MATQESDVSIQTNLAQSLEPLTVVCWKWHARERYRSKFGPAAVNTLYSMFKRHYHAPFRMVCITDDGESIRDEVTVMPLWKDYGDVPSPHGSGNPSCYRRLKMYQRDAASFLGGSRILSIDLDVVLTGDCTPLFKPDVEFRMYGDTARGTPYNGSIQRFTAGARPQLWEKFDPRTSPGIGTRLKYIGSDQAWIGACLGPNEQKFTKADGVYSYRNQILPGGGILPANCRLVILHGHSDPWTPLMRSKHSWIAEHYR